MRRHTLLVDQPVADGGEDAGPTPVELFVASLATCVGHYAKRALGRDADGATVHAAWTMSPTPPWRVADVVLDVDLPAKTTPARRAAVLRAVSHCTVHNSIVDPPHIRIEVTPPQETAHPAAA